MKIGDIVKVNHLPDNVTDDVKVCLGEVGEITAYGSRSKEEYKGYYIAFDNHALPKGKRFYENELTLVRSIEPDDCSCWNPDVTEEVDYETGDYCEYCDHCGNPYFKACNPRDDVLRTLISVRENIGKPAWNDEVVARLLEIAINQIRQTS